MCCLRFQVTIKYSAYLPVFQDSIKLYVRQAQTAAIF